MIDRLAKLRDNLRKEGFARSVLLISSGATINILLNIFLTPIVARLYDKEDYGLASVFASIVNLGVLVVTLMYPSAIVIPKEDSHAHRLIKGSFLLAAFSGLVFLLLYFIFSGVIQLESVYSYWIVLLPIGILVMVFDQVTAFLSVRDKQYKLNATGSVVAGLLNKGCTIGYAAILGSSQFGIIGGFLVSHVVASTMRARESFRTAMRSAWSLPEIKASLLLYASFPKYVLPGNFINRFSRDMPLYFLSSFFTLGTAGSFAFAISMLTLPYNLIGASVSPVFVQRAVELRDTAPDQLMGFVKKTTNALFLVSLAPFSILTVFGGELFALVFSSRWKEAGVFAGSLSLYFMFRIISAPLSSIFRVLQKEREMLVFNVLLFLARGASLLVGWWLFQPLGIIQLFSVVSAIGYISLMIMTFRLVQLSWLSFVVRYVASFYGVVAVLWLIKYGVITFFFQQ